jgi:uncharacterized membrane protein SpoIIM required for sporulation
MALTSAVTEVAFTERRRRDWERLDTLARRVQGRGLGRLTADEIAGLSPLYLDLCADLSRAQAARYSAQLVDYLQGLTAAAHSVLYGSQAKSRLFGRGQGRVTWPAVLEAFPRAVRRHRTAMLVSFLLFFVPMFGGLFATLVHPSFAASIVPESMLRPLVHSYRQGFDEGRGAGVDAAMAGFYVHNNVGIALRCFATGIAFGLGSAFYLVENGLTTGAIMGYVAAQGAGGNIFTFIVGHGSLELGAIVLAGGAGLSIGWSVVAPGDQTRLASLQAASRSVTVVVLGAALMLFMAAAVEGFWSASSVPASLKRAVGGLMFLTVAAYILLAGRRSTEAQTLERQEAEPWT